MDAAGGALDSLVFVGSVFVRDVLHLGQKFKTREVCGIVRDVSGEMIPGALVQCRSRTRRGLLQNLYLATMVPSRCRIWLLEIT